MKRIAWICYLLALHIALGVLVARRLTAESPFIPAMRVVHQRIEPQVPPGSVVFLGDSITQSFIPPFQAVNYGIGWQRSDQLLESIKLYPSLSRARVVFLNIGTNDLLQHKEAGIEDRYRAILAAIPAPVVMSNFSPELSAAARAACVSRCALIEVRFSPEELLDGVHPNAKGYAKWANLIAAQRLPAPSAMPAQQ